MHTKGPWKAEGLHRWPNGQRSGRPYIFAPDAPEPYRHVCELFLEPPDTDANARLIAAAPALLEALQRLTAAVDRLSRDFDTKYPALAEAWFLARAAIAQATT